MRLIVVVMPQPAPGLIISTRQVFEWRRTKLRVAREKANDLERVFITNYAHAATPRVAIAIRQNQVPPQLHLLFQRRPDGIENVLSAGCFGSQPNKTSVFV